MLPCEISITFYYFIFQQDSIPASRAMTPLNLCNAPLQISSKLIRPQSSHYAIWSLIQKRVYDTRAHDKKILLLTAVQKL